MNKLLRNKMNQLTKGKKKGFTLVELIIVIAIIAILAAVAIPKFGQITKDANIKADISTAKTIHTATAQLLAEKPTAASATDFQAQVAKKLDGGTMPTSKAESQVFVVAVNATTGDITVSSNSKEVYPTLATGYGGN